MKIEKSRCVVESRPVCIWTLNLRVITMVTEKFSLYFIGLWKRDASLLLRQHNNGICACCVLAIVCMEAISFASFTNTTCIVYIYMLWEGSETFRFLLPIGCMEARSFASFTNTTLYVLWEWKRNISLPVAHWLYGSEKFRFLLPIGYYKRNVSLSRTQYKNA